MFDHINHKFLTLLLVILVLNTYVLKIEVVNVLVVVIGVITIIYSNRSVFRTLSIWQNLGLLLLFIGTVFLLALFYIYVASPVVNLISIGWLRSVVVSIVVLITLIPTIIFLYKGMSKITNGKFPVSDIEEEFPLEERPINDEVKQLVNEGKIVQATKLSRELYGYSLLEAKKYVDSLR